MAQMMRVRTVLSYGSGSPALGTHYLRGAAFSVVLADATDAVARVRAFWAAVAGLMDNGNAAAVQGAVDVLDEQTGVLQGGFSPAPPAIVTGTGGATTLPPATQVLCRLATGGVVAGRRLQGRVNIGRVALSASTSTGGPTVAVGTACVAAGTALLAGGGPAVPVVWHRPIAAGSGITFSITGATGAPFFAVIRSRRD